MIVFGYFYGSPNERATIDLVILLLQALIWLATMFLVFLLEPIVLAYKERLTQKRSRREREQARPQEEDQVQVRVP